MTVPIPIAIGDKLRTASQFGILISHYGIYVGARGPSGQDVVHNAKDGGVSWAFFHDFAGGDTCEIESRAAPGTHELVANAAIVLIGCEYNLLSFNCEQFANFVQNGKPESKQLKGAVTLGLLGLGTWLLTQDERRPARRSSRSRFDRRVGRYRRTDGRFAKR